MQGSQTELIYFNQSSIFWQVFARKQKQKKKSFLNNKRDSAVCWKLQDALLFQSRIIFPLKNKFFEEIKSSHLDEVKFICLGFFLFV